MSQIKAPNLNLLYLESSHHRAVRELDEPYELHRTLSRTLWHSRMNNEQRATRLENARLLFRAEPEMGRVWMSSLLIPDFKRLDPGYLAAIPIAWTFQNFPNESDELFIRIKTRPQKRSGKTAYFIHEKNELDQWLNQQGEKHGFHTVQHDWQESPWFDTKAGYEQRQSFDLAAYVRVTNPILFAEAMCTGIGREKAKGHGLVLVHRVVPWGQPDLVAIRGKPNTTISNLKNQQRP